jgi:hypothetical protein
VPSAAILRSEFTRVSSLNKKNVWVSQAARADVHGSEHGATWDFIQATGSPARTIP